MSTGGAGGDQQLFAPPRECDKNNNVNKVSFPRAYLCFPSRHRTPQMRTSKTASFLTYVRLSLLDRVDFACWCVLTSNGVACTVDAACCCGLYDFTYTGDRYRESSGRLVKDPPSSLLEKQGEEERTLCFNKKATTTPNLHHDDSS